MKNPIIQRELIGLLRSRKAPAMLAGSALFFSVLVLVRWPSEGQVSLSGVEAREVFTLLGHGLLMSLVLLAPIVPATSIVRERQLGTLALLLNSPMNRYSIYAGKLIGSLGFVLLLLVMSFPAAAASYAMGGVGLAQELLPLYGLLALVALQYTVLGLFVSSRANSTDGALRGTYGLVLLLSVVTLGPHQFLQGTEGVSAEIAATLRHLSPLPAVLEILGHGDLGSQGLINSGGAPLEFLKLSLTVSALFAVLTLTRLGSASLDRPRPQGVMTEERSLGGRLLRRFLFLSDPQRRTGGIGPFTNPVLVKEFRCRQFGRMHWLLRLVAASAVLSLALTYAATLGTFDWGAETIGGIMVLLQVSLIVLLAPSLTAGLISTERESGGWEHLKMTPLSAGAILRGKLLSSAWTLLLLLCATVPGYLVMIYISPPVQEQVWQVLVCLVLLSVLAIVLGAAISTLFRQTALATLSAYAVLIALCGGTTLVWLGRGAPFGHATVERVLTINPLAAALSVMRMPGFAEYNLVPANWWLVGTMSVVLFLFLVVRTRQLTRPE